MRPVVRGACPQDAHGAVIKFTDYASARRDMIARLGEYCSYCEMQLDASLAIEHVKPKQPPGAAAPLPERELVWGNFLLACTNCNSTKGNAEIDLNDYLWPDRDNTFRAMGYAEGGLVSSVLGIQHEKAEKLIALVGLGKTPDTATASDRRWLNRREAWDMATRSKERLTRCNLDDMKNQIIETVQAKGFWSIWMTVFKDDADMLIRLITAFPGTSSDCFDAVQNHAPIARPGGQC